MIGEHKHADYFLLYIIRRDAVSLCTQEPLMRAIIGGYIVPEKHLRSVAGKRSSCREMETTNLAFLAFDQIYILCSAFFQKRLIREA